jgi:glycosyltransferase involved in cell wall biosynthesis
VLDLFEQVIRPAVPESELWFVADERVDVPGVRSFVRVGDDELASLYRRAWAFVLPSTYEGFGVPYLEAMASGTIPVATPNDGAAELLADGPGLVVDDPELGATLAGLLADPERCRRAGLEARERALAYDLREVVLHYEAVYRLARRRLELPERT